MFSQRRVLELLFSVMCRHSMVVKCRRFGGHLRSTMKMDATSCHEMSIFVCRTLIVTFCKNVILLIYQQASCKPDT